MTVIHQRSAPTWAVITVLSLCGTVVALQQTMVVPLLPEFPRILGISTNDATWLVTATLLSSAIATPIISRLADMFGKRRMMTLCMTAMTIGSVLAAAGGVYLTTIIGRSLQGFAFTVIPIGISIMRDELPPARVPAAVALMSTTLGIGAALGLPLSGVIYQHLGWQAVFWLSAVAGTILIATVHLTVSESTIRIRGRFDYLGAALLTVALTGLLLIISKGSGWGWGSPLVIGLIGATIAAFTVWVPWELRASLPLIDVRTSTRRPILLTNCATLLVGFAMFANLLLTTQQLQLSDASGYGLGLSPTTAGLAMVPTGLALILFAPVSGRLISKYGGRVTLITGAAVMGVAYFGRVFIPHSAVLVIAGSVVVGAGTAISHAAMPTLIMATAPVTETASANGLNALIRAIGTAISSAVVAALLGSIATVVGTTALPSISAFRDIYFMAGLGALAACAFAWFIPIGAGSTNRQRHVVQPVDAFDGVH